MSGGTMAAPAARESWCDLGATDAQADELAAYMGNAYDHAPAPAFVDPPADEPFVATWEEYVSEAARVGAAACLRSHFVQLRFPVAQGMSETAAYCAATRRGEIAAAGTGAPPAFASPNGLRLLLHETAAGRVPVILTEARADFELIVRALTRRNEPARIPESMGACIVAGYNNWDRIRQLRADWKTSAADASPAAWWSAFQTIAARRELYQDRFILLSSGPYSGVSAERVGVAPERWRQLSIAIRLEHECTHFIIRCLLGAMRNSLLDELIADYLGLVAACGHFRYDWFLNFMGLECFPRCRPNGRIWNYRGTPPLSDGAFGVLQRTVVEAAARVWEFDVAHGDEWRSITGRARLAVALARTGLPRLASAEAGDVLTAKLSEVS